MTSLERESLRNPNKCAPIMFLNSFVALKKAGYLGEEWISYEKSFMNKFISSPFNYNWAWLIGIDRDGRVAENEKDEVANMEYLLTIFRFNAGTIKNKKDYESSKLEEFEDCLDQIILEMGNPNQKMIDDLDQVEEKKKRLAKLHLITALNESLVFLTPSEVIEIAKECEHMHNCVEST